MFAREISQLLAYWHSLGGGEQLPERSALDLRELKPLLPWMFILAMAEDGSLRYRLAGSSLEAAIGRGMANQIFSDVFANSEHAMFMEELYATSLVQGCGLFRRGTFNLLDEEGQSLEVIALPFQDTRTMGGTVLVGLVAPFEVQNQGFVDHWGELEQNLSALYSIPSPHALGYSQLSERVQRMLLKRQIQFNIMDVKRTLKAGNREQLTEQPEISVLSLGGSSTLTVN